MREPALLVGAAALLLCGATPAQDEQPRGWAAYEANHGFAEELGLPERCSARLRWPFPKRVHERGPRGPDYWTTGTALCCVFKGSEEEGRWLNALALDAVQGVAERDGDVAALVAGQYVWMVRRTDPKSLLEEATRSGLAALAQDLEGIDLGPRSQVAVAGLGLCRADDTIPAIEPAWSGPVLRIGVVSTDFLEGGARAWLERTGCSAALPDSPMGCWTALGLKARERVQDRSASLTELQQIVRQIVLADRLFCAEPLPAGVAGPITARALGAPSALAETVQQWIKSAYEEAVGLPPSAAALRHGSAATGLPAVQTGAGGGQEP